MVVWFVILLIFEIKILVMVLVWGSLGMLIKYWVLFIYLFLMRGDLGFE